MAGFGVLWRVLGMKAGHSKSMRVLGIVGIVAFVGFFIMRYEIFVETTLILIASLIGLEPGA